MKKTRSKEVKLPYKLHFPKEYFAGILSKNGFVNYLPEYTKQIGNYYIIKGTAGSGKSTLMKKVAHSFEGKGERVEYIRCSSDPFSLDGIIVPSRSFAMVDGTSPHVTEPLYPIAREKMINTADYIDNNKIKARKDEIINLTNEKKKRFENGERLLKCACILENAIISFAKESISTEKVNDFCKKMIEEEKNSTPKNGIQKTLALVSFSKNGFKSLFDSLEVNKIYKINSLHSIDVFSELKKQTIDNQLNAVFSPSPFDVNEICAVYFCASRTLFVDSRFLPQSVDKEKSKTPNFEANYTHAPHKEKIKFLKSTQNLILNECKSTLAEGMKFHSQLEEIYSSSLDKNALDDFTKSLIDVLSGK